MMLMIPGGYASAAPDAMPDPEGVKAMMKYNEELNKVGVLLSLDGLHPPATGARVSFKGGKRGDGRDGVRTGAGMAIVDALKDDPRLKASHLLPTVRGDLLERLGRGEEPRAAFRQAAGLSGDDRERQVLLARASNRPSPPGPPSDSP